MSSRSSIVLLLCFCAACSRTPLGEPEVFNRCLQVEPEAPLVTEITASVDIVQSDILFLIDSSASMYDEIGRIREQLVEVLIPRIREQVSDSRMAVATFSDFGERRLGERSHPYRLLQDMTEDVTRVRRAIEAIEVEPSGDEEETQLEALYQAATGEGLGVYVDPHSCPEGTRGGVCFREGSFATIMLFTDAPMRNVEGATRQGEVVPEEPFDPRAPDVPFIPYVREYDETIEALQAEQIRVIGLWSGGGSGIEDLWRVTRESGALDEDGMPIVYDIGRSGGALDAGVIQSLERVTQGVRLDVGVELYDADLGDGLDPRDLVVSVRPVSARPSGSALLDVPGERFLDVAAGTEVTFAVTLDPRLLPEEARDRRFSLGIVIQGDEGTHLHEETVDVLVASRPDACRSGGP